MSKSLQVTRKMKLKGKQEKCPNPRSGPARGFAGGRTVQAPYSEFQDGGAVP